MEEHLRCLVTRAARHTGSPSLGRAILVLVILLTSAAAAVGGVTVPAPDVAAVFEKTPDGERMSAPGFGTIASPGDPALPFAEVRVVLPPDAEPASVSLVGAKTELLQGAHDIAPAPPMATSVNGSVTYDWGAGKRISGGRNSLTYGRDAFFPSSNVEIVDTGNMRKWRIATVRYYPYRWNPASRRLELTTGGDIAVALKTGPVAVVSASQGASDRLFADQVRAMTANFDEAAQWYGGPGIVGAALPGYAIITTSAIVAGSAKLQAFAAHKASRGFSVSIFTEAQWGGGTGDAAADRIRSFLKSNYIGMALKYVLLIGNPNPSNGDVPMKMLWPRHNSSTYQEAPSDYYYADLTGNWDRDGDGYYGEGDNDFGYNGIDRYPEVIVGRIPFYGSFAELDSILQKTIDYEAGGIGGSWVRNVLLSMKPSDASTPGYHLGEAIRADAAVPAGFSTTRVYEQTYGLNPPPDYTPCSYDTVLTAWKQHAGFWFWWTHGNENLAADVMTTDRTVNLDDHYPSFTFQCSCLNSYPERTDNLSYALLKRGAIVANSATRVSWYYPGQTSFTSTDSNAGMTYRYAVKLVRDHKPCGDAHYEMMVEVPNNLWANHCVFNLYGDPSVAYASAPVVSHTPLADTDNISSPYRVEAGVASNGPLAAGSPSIRWSTNGGATFSTSPMALADGALYAGEIPAQPLGTVLSYYIRASDTQGRTGLSPTGAPTALHSFTIKADSQAPTIQHVPLANTGDTTGPYVARATVTDDCGVSSVALYYSVNGGASTLLSMQAKGGGLYEAAIPGPRDLGDRISYHIVATDTSSARKTTREPSVGEHSFSISTLRIAVYDCVQVPPYFVSSNSNICSAVVDALNTDPRQRFQAAAVTSLTQASLSGQDGLVLPDNGVFEADASSVSAWFTSGKVLVAIDSSANYAAYSGFLWPSAAGSSGYNLQWDQYASVDDQQIVLQDPITSGYQVGQVIKSRGYGAQFYIDQLPEGTRVLSVSSTNPTRAYAVYRDVPGHGRFVALGPFRPLETVQYSMLREALAARSSVTTVGIAQAKSLADGETVRLEGKVVICGVAGASYVEEPDRTAGIRVAWSSGLTLSRRVTLTGRLSTVDGERVLLAENVEDPGTPATVQPIAMALKALGGGRIGRQPATQEYRTAQAGWQILPSLGANNIGLLVRVAGTVTAVGADHFYLDDGSGCDDGSGYSGVRVLCGAFAKPVAGSVVVVTGVSSTWFDGQNAFRALVVPTQAQIRVLR